MELIKTDILKLSLFQSPLQINFKQIQQQFNKLTTEIKQIKLVQTNIQSKINLLTLRKNTPILENKRHIKRENQEILSNNTSELEIKNSLVQVIGTQHKVTDCFVQDNIHIQNNYLQNQIKHQEPKMKSKQSKNQKIQKSKISSKPKNKEFEEILNKLRIFQQNQQQYMKSIKKLQNQNIEIKKIIELKLSNPKKRKENEDKSKKKIVQNSNENGKKEEDQNIEKLLIDEDCNYSKNQQFPQINTFLMNKVRVLSQQLANAVSKIEQLQRGEKILSKGQQLLKRDIQILDKQSHQKNKKSQETNRKIFEPQSRILNDTMQSTKAYYEEKLIQLFEEMEKLKRQYFVIIEKMNQDQKDKDQNQLQRKKNLAIRMQELNGKDNIYQQLKKQIHHNKKDLKKIRQQFDNLINGFNNGSTDTKTYIIKPNQNKQDWKALSTKIYKLKIQLLSNIKDLESKINTNNQISVVLNQLEAGIGQCKIVLNRKVQIGDYQKSIKRIDNRLNNFMKQIYQKEGIVNEQDAMAARQPWFCLSCSSQLKNYTGKIIKGPQVQKLQGKKVNPESHMVRNQSKLFPTLASFHS